MRLDNFLVENKCFDSRTKASQAIKRGEVFVNGTKIDKPSQEVTKSSEISIRANLSFVSLGGYKLDKALKDFNLNVNNVIACDVGASTGGFTDCLLQNGAKKVYSVDLNDELLHYSLKEDARVVEVIKNAKQLNVDDFDEQPNFLCADLSFISATQVIDVFYNLLPLESTAVLLIKPQFETGVKKKFKNGIIREQSYRIKACKDVYERAVKVGFKPIAITTAPEVKGKNVEYLILLKKDDSEVVGFEKLFK